MRKKSADPFFDVYRNVKKEKLQPSRGEIAMGRSDEVARVPRVACFDSFFIE